jgi:antirestriction protein ArdC
VHSTGHPDRLDRKGRGHATNPYAREELVAEIGACFLTAEAGLTVEDEQSAAYIDGWLEALRSDRRLVVQAAAAAQKAVDLILNRRTGEQLKPESTRAA